MPIASTKKFHTSGTSIKCVPFRYEASEELSSLFEDFRLMCNDAVRIATQTHPKSKFNLIELSYPALKAYGLHSHYILSACEVAYSVNKNRNRKSVPYIAKPFLKLDNQTYQLNHLILRIPTTPRRFIYLTLQGSEHHLSYIDNNDLRKGSLTITSRSVCISFSKEVEFFEPVGSIGVDTNERNVTISGTNGCSRQFQELGDVVEIRENYRVIRGKIAKRTRGDRRIAGKLLAKYGKREKNRTAQSIHKFTKLIVSYAKENKLGIKMEKLTGIRKRYRKGNWQAASFRARMNTWAFWETQRQIDYKSKWDGVPCWYVNPRGTSSHCPCGSRVVRLAERKLYCPPCNRTWDRDDLASKNIMACVVPQVRPPKGSSEGERGVDGSNPQSRWREG